MDRTGWEKSAEIVRLPSGKATQPVRAADRLPAAIAAPALPTQLSTAMLARRIELEVDCCDLFEAQLRERAPPLFDARVRRAYFAGRIPHAIHLPAEQVNRAALEPFAKAGYVLVYGTDALRLDGVRAACAIAELGIPVKLVSGGYAAWVAEGFPIERPPAFADRIPAI